MAVYIHIYVYTHAYICTHRPSHAQSPGSMTITFFDKCPLVKKKKKYIYIYISSQSFLRNPNYQKPSPQPLSEVGSAFFPAVLFSHLLLLVRLT